MRESVSIPTGASDLDSFRRWARSPDFPSGGRYCFLDGDIWVDLTPKDFFSHNQVKGAVTAKLGRFCRSPSLGYLFSTRAVWSNPAANLSIEPDAFFVTYESIRSDRARFISAKDYGVVELEGTPDMALAVVCDSSEERDTMILKKLYGKAGVHEYWLIDARGAAPNFRIWQLKNGNYALAANDDGWIASTVFGRSFKVEQGKDPLGHPQFELLVR